MTNINFCFPRKKQSIEPYIVVSEFQKTTEKQCCKDDIKNQRIYQELLNKANKSQRIIQNSGLSMNLEVPIPPRPSNRDRFILWKKRNISKPVIEQSNAIIFLQNQGLKLDIDYEAYQAIDLMKEIKKEKGIRENYTDKSIDFSKVHTEHDTNILRKRSIRGFNNFRNRRCSSPIDKYQDTNRLNSFHNECFEGFNQHKTNDNFVDVIPEKSSSPKLIHFLSDSSLNDKCNESVRPSAPPLNSLQIQGEKSPYTENKKRNSLYPSI